MGAIYKNVKFRFHKELWAAFCEQAIKKHGLSDIAEMIAVDEATIKSWINQYYKDAYPHPSMTKFIDLCGLMDVDPGEFFTIQDEE